jgi:ligand-binding sensor domain-containing protein
MRWRVVLLTVVVMPLCLEGEVLPIRSYTTADGLASDHIDCIVPDSRGFIWFCTPEGLTRFDGYRMVSFGTADGLPHRSVDSFLETRSGAYLAGTDRGLSQFDSRAGGNKFIAHRPAGDGFDRPVYPLRESRSGKIWCGMLGGLFEALSGGRFRRQPLPVSERISVTDILEDPGGQLWVATIDGIFVLGQGGAVQHITKKDGLPDNWVNALLWDSAGRLWAGTRGGLVLLSDGGACSRSGVQRVYADKDGLAGTNVLALAEGSDGAVWMGTSVGISRLLPGIGDSFCWPQWRGCPAI